MKSSSGITSQGDCPDCLKNDLPITFLSRLFLPPKFVMASTAVEHIAGMAMSFSFTNSEITGIKIAAEEAFLIAVAQNQENDEPICIEISLKADSLCISFWDKGIPFDQKQVKRFTESDSNNQNPLAMNRFMDKAELIQHGKNGREMRLYKNIQADNIPVSLITSNHNAKKHILRKTVKNPLIKFTRRSEDISEICRLAWRCYGFSHEELLYDPDILSREIDSGALKSVIAIDPLEGSIIGHIALKYHLPEKFVPELSLAFVDPDVRCPGLPMKMARILLESAGEGGAKGMFDCSVTSHLFSQKGIHELGSRPCCIMLGIAAFDMQAKKLKTTHQRKGSTVNHFYALDRSSKKIFIPSRHMSMVQKIYGWLQLPREYGKPLEAIPEAKSLVEIIDLPASLNASFIVVQKIGNDTAQQIADAFGQCLRAAKDAVYIFISTENPASPQIVEYCEHLGFFFSGIMPLIHNGEDRIMLQYLNIPLDITSIKLYGEMSKELFNYIIEQQAL